MSDLARTHKFPCPHCREWVYADATGWRNAFTGTAHVHQLAPVAAEGEPDGVLWCNAVMDCVICNRRWVATFPSDAADLECPGCGYLNPAPPVPEGPTDD